jgi:hypothetical protein
MAARGKSYPVLERAAARIELASNPTVEWMVGNEVWTNYCQIFRNGYVAAPEGSKSVRTLEDGLEALDELLASIERQFTDGTPVSEVRHRFTGGYKHYLGRDSLDPDDQLILRELRSRSSATPTTTGAPSPPCQTALSRSRNRLLAHPPP